ncbi:hypothetical protein [Paractinoplanes toevensis]|uniref:hypothetical protein n=1 Tax=Paractinoplanes toevensis TaxID=571911 RepID=UPI001BB41CDB|nr:hypothetical protein [Actinoplanes toevensis]
MQTAVRRFTHPDTDRTITLVGTYHLAKPDYWRDLGEVIDKLEANGAVVHCEASGPPDPEADMTPQEREAVDQLVRMKAREGRRLTALGWTDQKGGLAYPDSWRVVDLDILQIVRRLGPVLAHKAAAMHLRMMDWPDTNKTRFNLFRVIISLYFRLWTSDKSVLKAGTGEFQHVLVEARNEHALAAAAGTDLDLVMIWGLAHLPGLEAGLIARGFERSGPPQWHTVMRRRPSIVAALLRLLVGWPAPTVAAEPDGQSPPSRP